MSRGDGIVLASLNLHGGRDRLGEPFDLEAALRGLTADVIVVQEAWHPAGRPDPVAETAASLGMRAIDADLLTGTDLASLHIAADPAPGRWGLALLTSRPVCGHEVVDLGHAARDMCARAALVARVAVPGGGVLRIAVAHLSHRFPASVGQLRRLAAHLARPADGGETQAADLGQAAGPVRAGQPGGTDPTVIVGDLNMPGPATLAATGYARAVRGRTFPSHRPVAGLDHMLTGPGVVALAGQVLPPAGPDHLPIRAWLRLP